MHKTMHREVSQTPVLSGKGGHFVLFSSQCMISSLTLWHQAKRFQNVCMFSPGTAIIIQTYMVYYLVTER